MKKKRMYRNIISIVVIALMMISFSVPSFAESGPGEPADFGAELDDGAGTGIDTEPGDLTEDPEDQPGSDTVEDTDGLPTEDEDVSPDVKLPGTPGQQKEGDVLIPGKRLSLKGMPAGFRLNSGQIEQKGWISSDGELAAFADMTEGEDYVPDEIVYLADTREEAEVIAEAYGTELIDFGLGVATAVIPEDNPATVEDLVRAAADTGNNLPPVSANVYRYAFGGMEDEGLEDITPFAIPQSDVSSQWHLGQENGINVQRAWESSTGIGVTVGVLDSGILSTHADLAPQIAGEAPEDVTGTGATDMKGHGTHVAGIIAAAAGNSPATVGVAPGAKIKSIKVLDNTGSEVLDGTVGSVMKGINRAVELELPIINLSLGGPTSASAEKKVVLKALDKGVAVIAAAGNDGGNAKMYPACYDKDVIVVASTDEMQRRSNFSNFGSWIDVAAPGSDILSLGITSNTATIEDSGTSMATPVVSGVAALILSEYSNPKLMGDLNKDGRRNRKDVQELQKRIKAAAIKTSQPLLGAGIIDASLAVSDTAVAPAFSISSGKTVQRGTTITLAAGNNDIYYTLDGKTPTMASEMYTGDITLGAAGKKTVKAIGVSLSGKYSKAVAATYTVKVPVSGVTINAVPDLVEGKAKSVQLSASVLPADATNKKLTWSFGTAPPAGKGYKITSAGKLTIPGKAAKDDAFTVVAKWADTSYNAGTLPTQQTATLPITIKENKATSVTATTAFSQGYLSVGQKVKLTATVMPADVADKKVEWELVDPADEEFLTLDKATGNLTVKKAKATAISIKVTKVGDAALSNTTTVNTTDWVVKSLTVPKSYKLFTESTGAVGNTVTLPTTVVYTEGTIPASLSGLASIVFTSSNTKIATVNPATGVVTAVGKGKATITAKATDKSGKSAKCAVTVAVPVKTLSIAAPAPMNSLDLAAGKSLQPKATVNSDAGSKKVSWSVTGGSAVVGTDFTFAAKTGKLTAKKGPATEGKTVIIQADATDGNGKTSDNTLTITLHDKAAAKVSFTSASIVLSSQAVMSLPISATNTAQSDGSYTGVYYSSNKPDIATVTQSGLITAKRPGKAVITATAKDYSGKKATCSVTVNTPASSLKVAAARNHYFEEVVVAAGKTMTFKPILGAAYGKPSVGTVDWTISHNASTGSSLALYNYLVGKGYIKIDSKTGKLTATSSILKDSTWKSSAHYLSLFVQAKTKDGTNISAQYPVVILDPVKYAYAYSNAKSLKANVGYIYSFPFYSEAGGFRYYGSSIGPGFDFTYTSSNPDVAYVPMIYSAYSTVWDKWGYDPNYDDFDIWFPIITCKKGSTKITITAADGSGKKVTIPVTVK